MKNIFKSVDLTKGNITKVLLTFTFPILISYLFQQIYTITDAAICGFYLNSNQVAGIGNVSTLVFMIMQFAFGCTAGFSVVTANAIGKKDINQSRKSLLAQMILSSIISILLTVVALFSLKLVLSFLGITEQSNIEIYESAITYTGILFLGIVAQIFYNLGCCFLRSLGNSKTPLMFLIISTLLNVILDLLFIAVFKIGVAGAALATIISQFISAISCFCYIFIKFKEYRFKKEDFHFEKGFIYRHIKLGVPLGLQNSVLAIGMIVMQAVLIRFDMSEDGVLGNNAQIGFTTASKLLSFLIQPFIALGTALISYTGQNYGAHNMDRVKKGIKSATIIGAILSVFCGGIGLLMSINGAYLHIFLSSEKINSEVIRFGNNYLYVAMPLIFLLTAIFLYRNVLQGLEKPLFPFIAGFLELFARTFVSLFIPNLINGGPINNLASNASYIAFCFSDIASWFIACVILILGLIVFFHQYKKQNNKLENKQ